MKQVFVTVVVPVRLERIEQIRGQVEALGNPAKAPLTAMLDGLGVIHFASLNVFQASARDRGHLVLELSGDGDGDELLDALARAAGAPLGPIFATALERQVSDLAALWKDHRVKTGQGPFKNPGLDFAGTPMMTVQRIRAEEALAARAAELLDGTAPLDSALDRLEAVRTALRAAGEDWALLPKPVPAEAPSSRLNLGTGAWSVLVFLKAFFWPLGLAVLLLLLALLLFPTPPQRGAWWPAALDVLETTFWVTLVAAPLLAGGSIFLLWRKERTDLPNPSAPDPRLVASIMARENTEGWAQNHMAALSEIKPGLFRGLTLAMGFWLILRIAAPFSRPGFLATLGTIHFARWVRIPGTRDLLFLSNYGGSWESYLEDFITRAALGITVAWSNTEGFPRTRWLVTGGAADAERFKRWARRQQIPTQFWYSAYPKLTTARIRTNAEIRRGLATARSEDEARRWLALFGSQVRPTDQLEANEIQSLLFGGFGFLKDGVCLGFQLSGTAPDSARTWLRSILGRVSFGDGRKEDHAVILGLARSGLEKCGLPPQGVNTFPPAFLEGMDGPVRNRLLKDEGDDAPANWWWGSGDRRVDGVLLLYAADRRALRELRASMSAALQAQGHRTVTAIHLRSLGDDPSREREPFGFVDGVSQPVVRGTYKGRRSADPIHAVEPGEFIGGYPDNRGNHSPGPTLPAAFDRAARLPPDENGDRDIGRNGSYLVVRQLEQNVAGFHAFCRQAAQALARYYPADARVTPEYVAAKMVGRWPDGRSLVRSPHAPTPPAAPEPAPSGGAGEIRLLTTLDGGREVEVRLPGPHGRVETTLRAALKAAAAPDAPRADNDFLFGEEDPQGLRCPFGAHIRRSNPRDSFDPGSPTQLAITNRHRILRVGRVYKPKLGQREGLLFMCLNGDIERQFEFIQQTWTLNRSFHGLQDERDPLTAGAARTNVFTVPTRTGPALVSGLGDVKPAAFVRTRGGGYFFLPGRRLLEHLAGGS